MTCADCTRAATDWTWGGQSNCPDCDIRAIAKAPRHIRELRYEQLRRKLGQEAAQAVIERVRAEHQRIKALKGTT